MKINLMDNFQFRLPLSFVSTDKVHYIIYFISFLPAQKMIKK